MLCFSSAMSSSLSSRSSLIGLCVECHDSYLPSRVTPFAHLEQFARSQHPHLSQPAHSAQLDFVSDVFLGLQRLHELLTITADGLYAMQAAVLARRDRSLYLVYLLLVLDQLPMLGWEEVAAYIRCQPPHAMLPLLCFLFDQRLQSDWMRQQWQTVYDVQHVDSHLLHSLRQHQQQAEALMERLAAQLQSEQARREQMAALAGEAASHSVAQQAATVPQPFELSQSKAKALPAPIGIPTAYKAREVPAAVSQSPSLQQLQQQRQLRRQSIREQTLLSLNAGTQPALATSQRPSTLARARQQMEDRLREETKQRTFARPVPAAVHSAAAAHKPTAAAILREEERYRKERAEEAERLLRFESELRDEAAFERWQSDKRAEDEQRRKEDIARRKHVMAQAQHDAQASVHRMVQQKQQHASNSKRQLDRQLLERQSDEEAQRRRREEAVKLLSAAEEETVHASLARLRRRKKEAAVALSEESRQLNDDRERRLEEEKAERRRLMLVIQAMEKLAAERAKRSAVAAESSTGGLNLLSDMSMAEMRARLALLQEEERQHVETKRERIEADKRSKAAVLAAMQQQHASIRASSSRQRDAERQQKRESRLLEESGLAAKLAEEGKETAARMEERKKEAVTAALHLAAQLSSSQQLTSSLQQQAARSRERALSDVAAGAERREASSRRRTEQQRLVEAEVERRKAADLSRVRGWTKQRTEQRREEADRRLAEAVSEHTRLAADEKKAYEAQHRSIVKQRQQLRQAMAASNPFAAQASEVDVRNGKETAQQRRQEEERWRAAQRAALSQQSGNAARPQAEQTAVVEEEKQQLSVDDTHTTAAADAMIATLTPSQHVAG